MLAALLMLRLAAPWGLGPPACLTAVSLDPAAGEGAAAVFEAVYAHCEGASEFRVVQLWIGDEVSSSIDRVNLGYEAGVFFIEDGGSCAPGDAARIEGPMGALDCAASSVTVTGNESVVRWAVEFDTSAFAGTHGVYFDAKGGEGDPEPRLGWTQMGTFVVQEDSSGSGSTSTSTSGSTSGTTGEGSSEGSSSSDTDAGSGAETGGSIPGGVIDQRGDTNGCGCTQGSAASSWWLFVLACVRRRFSRRGA
jgi:hypothetical protein